MVAMLGEVSPARGKRHFGPVEYRMLKIKAKSRSCANNAATEGSPPPAAVPLLYADLEGRLVELRGVPVLLDADVARLYGVETRAVNQAVRRNLDKFPQGYFFELTKDEANGLRSQIVTLDDALRSQIVTANISPKSRAVPKAFTEKGLYMLATILKSEQATAATSTPHRRGLWGRSRIHFTLTLTK